MSNQIIAALKVVLGLDTGPFQRGATEAQIASRRMVASIEGLGRRMTAIGAGLSVGITAPFTALVASAIPAARESAEAMGQVNAALTSMGPVAHRTAAQLQEQARALMHISTFDDDEILRKVTANMLTFGHVSGEAFDRAQRAAVNLSTRLGQDLQTSAIQVGRALNDPVRGLAALRRIGVQFTDQQKDQVAAMVAAGNTAGAQALILRELEGEFGGAAQAMRDATPGAALRNQWDDLKETIGGIALNVLPRLLDPLERVLAALNRLSPATQTLIFGTAALGAAVGPVMTTFGGLTRLFAPLAPRVVELGMGFGSMAARLVTTGIAAASASGGVAALTVAALPWIALAAGVAAAGYAIYQNWDKIAPVLESLKRAFVETIGPRLTSLITSVRTALTQLWQGPLGAQVRFVGTLLAELGAKIGELWRGPLGAQLRTAIAALGSLWLAWQGTLGRGLIGLLGSAIAIIEGTFNNIAGAIRVVSNLLTGNWAGAWNAMRDIVRNNLQTLLNVIGSFSPDAVRWIAATVRGISEWMTGRLNAVWEGVRAKIATVRGWFHGLYDAVVGHSYIPDMVTEIGQHMARLNQTLVAPARGATQSAAEAFRDLQQAASNLLDRLFPEAARQNAFNDELATLRQYAEKGRLSVDQLNEAILRLRRDYSELPENFWHRAVDVGGRNVDVQVWTPEHVDRVLSGAREAENGVRAVNVRIAESFSQLANDALKAVDRIVKGIKSGDFLDVLGGVLEALEKIGGMTPNGLNLFGLRFGGARAIGGAVSSGHAYLVGERGPELFSPGRSGSIIPNSALTGTGGGTTVINNWNGVMTAEDFWSRIAQGHDDAAQRGAVGGAQMAVQQLQRGRQRALA